MSQVNICGRTFQQKREGVSIGAPGEVGASQVPSKTAGRPCTWSKGKKKEVVRDRLDDATGDSVQGFLGPVQDFSFYLE